MIRFDSPWWLVLGVVALVVVALRLRTLPREHAGARRRAIQLTMLLACACAGLALAGLELGRRVDRVATIFVLDRSRSVDHAAPSQAETLDLVRASVARKRPDDRVGVLGFASTAATEIYPTTTPALSTVRAPVAREGTDVSAGLRRALADLPSEHAGRIVLVSDGNDTEGDVVRATQLAASRGVPIDVLPVVRRASAEISVQQVRVPPYADPHEPIELRIVTHATRDADVEVLVRRDGVAIARGQTHVRGGDDLLTMRDEAPTAGLHRYDVTLTPRDASSDEAPENNEGAAFLRVSGGSRALVLAQEPARAEALAEAIRRSGVTVELAGASAVPPDLATLAGYDLLVLSDLEARAFSEEQMRHVAAYVRDLGGGLLMVGARRAFGLGGYAYTPIEEVLPATFDLRKRRDRASLSMIIAIDKSGSMGADAGGGRTKLDLANEAAARSAMLLAPMDRVGVMHVDTAVEWTQPMTSVDDPARIAERCRRATVGGGGILVDLTLQASYDRLRGEPSQLKHLLLFSDGSDSEDMTRARSLVSAAARDHITTSVVSMGNGGDTPELEVLARLGSGRFYIVDDLSELPRIFTQETVEASRSSLAEKTFRATSTGRSGATRGIDFGTAPALAGYAIVNERPTSVRLLSATAQDPLLLTWQHGVGRSGIFATDVGAYYGRSWLAWPGYTALFGQLARDLARAAERRDARVAVRVDGSVGHVLLDAVDRDGRYRNYLESVATVAGPAGRNQRVTLVQSGAGRYEATFDATVPGPYLITIQDTTQAGIVASAGVVRPRGDELRGEGTDYAKLAQIAALSGGRVRRDLDRVFDERPPRLYAYDSLWRELVVISLISLLFSVALRRLVWPSFRRRARAQAVPAAPSAAPATLPSGAIAHPSAAAGAFTPSPATTPPRSATPVAPPAGTQPPVAGAPPSAPPASLAETLLARKKKK